MGRKCKNFTSLVHLRSSARLIPGEAVAALHNAQGALLTCEREDGVSPHAGLHLTVAEPCCCAAHRCSSPIHAHVAPLRLLIKNASRASTIGHIERDIGACIFK